jgi:predicted nuclease of restriction endonuclease-like (RecB) superfamily
MVLLAKLKTPLIRLWYAHKTIEHGWSRAVLTHHIETQLHKREGKAVTNFQRTLPPPQSDLAEQTLKDPYNFDFLTIRSDAHERDLEQGLLDHIQKFLLELGVGFAFVGRQYHMEISGQDYYLDLLFYHLRLRCYAVIDLKMKAFEPEFAGKMNFYLSAVDDQLRHADDRPSIGLLLCKERDHLTVEYALRDLKKPIGVAQWQTKLVESLPRNLKGSLPTVAEIPARHCATRCEIIRAGWICCRRHCPKHRTAPVRDGGRQTNGAGHRGRSRSSGCRDSRARRCGTRIQNFCRGCLWISEGGKNVVEFTSVAQIEKPRVGMKPFQRRIFVVAVNRDMDDALVFQKLDKIDGEETFAHAAFAVKNENQSFHWIVG